jgi:diphosphomevalonate decarboxylase
VSEATALAHPNFALSKYWGKHPAEGNFPAVPSLSITVSGLSTRTNVRFLASRSDDRVVIGGREERGAARTRVTELLQRVRSAAGDRRHAEVISDNDFPTASGLASSASGFAALALAATRAIGLDWDASRVSDLARRSSASAARSIFGGFVELPDVAPGKTAPDQLSARPVAPAEHLPLVVLIAIATDAPKSLSSSDGMRQTLERSPYANAWLTEAPRLHERLRSALLTRDFVAMGKLTEASALAMHAAAIAAGVCYWDATTVEALRTVWALRNQGVETYATIDAGPHVKVFSRPADARRIRSALEATPGICRIVEGTVGEGARLVNPEDPL